VVKNDEESVVRETENKSLHVALNSVFWANIVMAVCWFSGVEPVSNWRWWVLLIPIGSTPVLATLYYAFSGRLAEEIQKEREKNQEKIRADRKASECQK